MIKVTVALFVLTAFASTFTHAQKSTMPSDAEIPQILIDRNPGVVL